MSEPEVTRTLARWAATLELHHIPEPVRTEGVRTFFNWLGCAIGGSGHETVERALEAVRPFAGPEQSTVLGRGERMDTLNAALVNGISSHVLDYDDTHLKTIIHPGGPVASAAFAVAELTEATGAELLTAVVAGVEACCRIGNAIYPDHYDRGWHITGTVGMFGAAVAAGRLLGLDEKGMGWAIGIAASQPTGLREAFGTMTKSLHPGKAAQNGALAALLAKSGFDASDRAIEAPRGFAPVLSTKQDYTQIVDGLGEHWEAALNSYKPFACGIVIHPTIDGCLQLRQELGPAVSEIREVHLRVHPLVRELTGKTEPRTGLEGKFSVYHAAAVALLQGDGSPAAFTDRAVRDPAVVDLRGRVRIETDPDVHEASAEVVAVLGDGRRVRRWVERAIGSRERPLSDESLEEKFRRQVTPTLGEEGCRHLIGLTWRLPELDGVAELGRVARG